MYRVRTLEGKLQYWMWGAVAALGIAAFAGPVEASTLIGDVIHAEYDLPTTGTAYPNSSVSIDPFTVGSGVDTVIDVEHVTFLDVDFSDNSLLITLNTSLTNPTWSSFPQNGPAFTIISGNPFPGISGVTSSNAGPISAFLQSGILFVNWAGMTYGDGDTVTITFTPVPSSWVFMLTAMVGLGALAYRRRDNGSGAAAA